MQTKPIAPTAKKVRITYVRSTIGQTKTHKATIRALGLRHLGDSVEKENTPAIRGMIDSVGHLVAVEVVE